MQFLAALALSLPLTACASAPAALSEADLRIYPDARDLPPNVQQFVIRWDDCTHWRGEDSYDAARGREIERAVAKSCTGLDALAVRLRRKYAGDAVISAALAKKDDVDW